MTDVQWAALVALRDAAAAAQTVYDCAVSQLTGGPGSNPADLPALQDACHRAKMDLDRANYLYSTSTQSYITTGTF